MFWNNLFVLIFMTAILTFMYSVYTKDLVGLSDLFCTHPIARQVLHFYQIPAQASVIRMALSFFGLACPVEAT